MAKLTTLKLIRYASSMSLQEIGELGFSKWTYTLVENGHLKSSKKMQLKISDIYDMRPRELFTINGFAKTITSTQVKKFIKSIKGEHTNATNNSRRAIKKIRRPKRRK